jgi:uncharacterized protein YjeT (DUF2065 family)
MRELFIAFGLFLFIEGILYALFPSKMKNMLSKLELLKVNQLRTGGLIFAILGFYNYLLFEGQHMKKFKTYLFSLLILISF